MTGLVVPAARRRRRLLLATAATLLATAAAELLLRAVDGYQPFGWPLRAVAREQAAGTELGEHRDFVAAFLRAQAAAQPGLDPAWFAGSPPAVPPHAVGPELAQRAAAFDKVFLYEFNEPLLRAIWVRGQGPAVLPGLVPPDTLSVFTPPDGGRLPAFRYPASTTLPDGLTTNAFGFRGRELAAAKPPGVVRIACVGASTTIGNHGLAYSWPELLEGFLSAWARREHPGIAFEVVNAGCEGYVSGDIRATVRYYVLPLDVDYVVYYEGANQFHVPELERHLRVHGDARRPDWLAPLSAREPGDDSWLGALAARSALVRRLRSALRSRAPLREPPKPPQELALPPGLDAAAPDLARAGEVLALGTILADLAAIRADAGAAGARLVVCSFCWFVRDGLALDPATGELAFRQLNADLWPCSYANLRALADLQNRWFAAFAAHHDADFLDVAAGVPADARLYSDAIHSTPLGARCQAWVVFAGLTRLLARDLAAGRVPAAAHGREPLRAPAPKVVTRAELDATAR